MTEEDLSKEIKDLNKRIGELESIIGRLIQPVQDMQSNAKGYLKLVNMAFDKGGLSPDMLVPGLKDPISKTIIKVLVRKNGQNISQITDMVRDERGSASRRIVREKLKNLIDLNVVMAEDEGKVTTYFLTEEVVRKWSQLLGMDI